MKEHLIGSSDNRSACETFSPIAEWRTARQKHIFVIDFLLAGKSIGELLAQKKLEQARWVIDFSRKGPNPELAMTDSVLFVRLRSAITDLMIKGWV